MALWPSLCGLLCGLVCGLALLMLPVFARTSYGHAVIAKSEPAANALLSEAPTEIRIWFTEPLEATYSTIQLRDATGSLVQEAPSQVDAEDDHQLVLIVGTLPDGVYTVVWRNVSSADGHQTAGSFPFRIGAAGAASSTMPTLDRAAADDLKLFDILSRWVNFWGLALAVGSIAFVIFVWQPATHAFTQGIPRPLWGLVWIGWLAAGIGGMLLLLNQATILLDQPLRDVLALGKVVGVVNSTRFGTLWLVRMGLWVVMGGLLLIARRSTLVAWLATACGLAMLFPITLFSHAAVSNDVALSVFSDWMHLAMTALWVGGLVQLSIAIPVMVKLVQPSASKLGQLVAQFSNFSRVAVVALLVTGIYATWHQVNTIKALTTTFYGQLLSVKLLLALLLLATAGINLVWTQRRLLAGQAIWVGRLRGLVALEVTLALGVLLVVGAMTAVNPARNEILQQEAAAAIPPVPEPQPITAMEMVDDLHIMLAASPGWVGNNTFTLQLMDEEGNPIPNATLIRLRFEHQTENLGESELQIRPEAEVLDGIYTIEGSNLSTVGDWRLRLTIQRPDEFDTVTDVTLNVTAPPSPSPPPIVEINPVTPNRAPVFLVLGITALLAGLFFLAQQRFRLWQGVGLMASLLVILGVIFLADSFLP